MNLEAALKKLDELVPNQAGNGLITKEVLRKVLVALAEAPEPGTDS